VDYSALAEMGELQVLHLEGVDPDLFLQYLSAAKPSSSLKIRLAIRCLRWRNLRRFRDWKN
jgi:hypothetical protein